MVENIVLGITQGITEWLPISSEGLLVLLQVSFFGGEKEGLDMIKFALFLHSGTLFAALIYLRKDVWKLLKTVFAYRLADVETQKILKFLIGTTIISGIVGFILLGLLSYLGSQIEITGKMITFLIGVLLLVTAFFQFKAKDSGIKKASSLRRSDTMLLGLVQGFAVLPGFSRSGLTIAALL